MLAAAVDTLAGKDLSRGAIARSGSVVVWWSAEMEELQRRGLIDGELLFLDSMLHMDPPQLETQLTATLERKRGVVAALSWFMAIARPGCSIWYAVSMWEGLP